MIELAVVDGCQFHFAVTRVVQSCRGLYRTMSVFYVRCPLVRLWGWEVIVMSDRMEKRESRMACRVLQVCSEVVASVGQQYGIEVCCYGLDGVPAP